MKLWLFVVMLGVVPFQAYSQDQLAIRLNEQGLLKILKMGVQYNTATRSQRTILIPQNIYKFTIKKNQLLSNPVVPLINEMSNLNMNRDLDFYLKTSDIKVAADVDSKSLKTSISNSSSKGFDLKVSLNLPRVSVTGPLMSLCEDKIKNKKQCGNGLKLSVKGLTIQTKGRPVVITTVLRLRTDGNVARVKVISVDSNLESRSAPSVDINLNSIEIPKISVFVNDQETVLDTSGLKEEILQRKAFLAKKLLAFAADFIASDVSEMLNVYLVNKNVETSWQLYRRENPEQFDEFASQHKDFYGHSNGDYQRPALSQSSNPLEVMMEQISHVMRHAEFGLSLKTITTPLNKDIELTGLVNLVLNNRPMVVKNTLGNSNRPLPKFNLSNQRNSDVNIVLSEPLINGMLDLVGTTGLFQDLFNRFSGVKGFSVASAKMHFTSNQSFKTVVNSAIDLKKLDSKTWGEWFKNLLAAYLERNNNRSVIYFPIEIEVIPRIVHTKSGAVSLYLKVNSPFDQDRLINNYKYPSNVDQMTDRVRKGVMADLKKSLITFVNKEYLVDVSKFTNQSGVIFAPKMIGIDQAAYLMLNLDILDIKFNSLKPLAR